MYFKSAFLAVALSAGSFVAMPSQAATTGTDYVYQGEELGADFDVARPIWQTSDPNVNESVLPDGIKVNYLNNWRSLTGLGCHVNNLINSVKVGGANVDMQFLTDDDLTNACILAQGVEADITQGPLVTVRDSRNYYAPGTRAGFCVVGTNGTTVLDLKVIKLFTLAFYRDGKLIKELPVGEGMALSGVNLTVGNIGGNGVTLGGTIANLSHFVDDDYDTYATVTGVNVGQASLIHVDLGEVIHPTHQLGIITSKETYLANVGAGDWITIRTYQSPALQAQLAAEEQGNNPAAAKKNAPKRRATDPSEGSVVADEFHNWSVADANVAGFGNKNVMYITPTKPFDQMQVQVNGVAEVANDTHLYGICTRGDSDGDGIPDCVDPVNSLLTGLATPGVDFAQKNDIVVSVSGKTVTATCSAGFERAMAFELDGTLAVFAEGEAGQPIRMSFEKGGIYLLHFEQADGRVCTVKVAL